MNKFNEKECWDTIMSKPGYSRTVNRNNLNKNDKNQEKIEFDFFDWQVPLIQDADVLEYFLSSLKLKGRVIKSIRAIGRCYNFGYWEIEEQVEDVNKIPEDFKFKTCLEIDEPLVIEFADGDRLEIDFSEASSLKMGLNTLSPETTYGTNSNNLDVNYVFSKCLNQEVTDYKVTRSDKLTSEYTGSSGIPEPKCNFIEKIEFMIGDDLKITFKPFFDYGEVTLTDKNDNILYVKWKDIKNSLTDEWDEYEKEAEEKEIDYIELGGLMWQGRLNWHKSLKNKEKPPRNKGEDHMIDKCIKHNLNK